MSVMNCIGARHPPTCASISPTLSLLPICWMCLVFVFLIPLTLNILIIMNEAWQRECLEMLKHVQISPLRNRSDTVSLRSSTSCSSSMCGSPEPPSEIQRTPSRASSYSSLNEQLPQTTIKVFTSCLKIDIEYKTLGIQWDTTSKEVIGQLLRRLKMRHRDPRLFYLSMEVSVRRAGVKTILVLDDDTRPAILQACHPKGESRFWLQLKPGGLIRVHTSALQPTSQYKSLVISAETTSDELLQLLLSCYNSHEPVEQFSIYEVCPGQEYQRKLHPDDIPLRAQAERMKTGETCHFLVRRNPTYLRRRQLLTTMNDVVVQAYHNNSAKMNTSASSPESSLFLLDTSMDSLPEIDDANEENDLENDRISITDSLSSSSSSESSSFSCITTTPKSSSTPLTASLNNNKTSSSHIPAVTSCPKCHNNFKSCEFCNKNSSLIHGNHRQHPSHCETVTTIATPHQQSYNPVYNIREIRTVSHSFSSLGSDKKLLDIQFGGRFDNATQQRMRPQSLHIGGSTRISIDNADAVENQKSNGNDKNSDMNGNALVTNVGGEDVKNDPAKGLGHFVYL